MAKKRRELTQAEKDDATRLRALWDRRDPKVSQAKFAADNDIGQTQGIIWQYLSGTIPLNVDVAIKFARGLKCHVGDFSPALEAERQRLAGAASGVSVPERLPPSVAQDILKYSAELSPAQQKQLLKALQEVVEANDVVKKTLKIPALLHPEDTEVAKALQKNGASELRVTDDPDRAEFERRQLPLFRALRDRS